MGEKKVSKNRNKWLDEYTNIYGLKSRLQSSFKYLHNYINREKETNTRKTRSQSNIKKWTSKR